MMRNNVSNIKFKKKLMCKKNVKTCPKICPGGQRSAMAEKFCTSENITMWLLTCKNTSLSNNKSQKATT